MRIYNTLFFLFLIFSLSFGQQGDGGNPNGITVFEKSGIDIPIYKFKRPNVNLLRAEDAINDSLVNRPWRFGYNYSTALDLNNSGVWKTTKNGDQIWMLKITCKQAETINLTFTNTSIPDGNKLYVYNPQQTFVLGAFTEHHLYQGELGSELVPGNVVYVEYYVPSYNSQNIGNVNISTVTYGYRTAEEYQAKIFGSSGSCQMNVNCPDGSPFKDQRNSVVMLVVGSNGFCSGALINNTQFDGRPYVLTANHCYVYNSNAASWVFRFNWQAPGCANPGSSPSFLSLSGAQFRARRPESDFCLVEITGGLSSGTVPNNYNPYFAGWNRSNTPPSSSFCIHHPIGDIKKISFDDDAPSVDQVTINGVTSDPDGVWRVEWDRNTAVESGSSGGPLFNNNGQIIGQLWGGNSNCSNSGSGGHDFYGRIHNSWHPTGSANDGQLEHWLDSAGTSETEIQGYDPYLNPLTTNVTALSLEGFKSNQCGIGFMPSVKIQNKGTNTLTVLTIYYTYNNEDTDSITWTGNLGQYKTETIPLPVFQNKNGTNYLSVVLTSPNGLLDEDPSDNSINASFHANSDKVGLNFEFYMGCFSDEVSWELKDEDNAIKYSGSDYPVPSNFNYLVTDQFCLSNGCYTLTLKDSYGDGVSGSSYSSCDYDGSMHLVQTNDNDTLAFLPESAANFGTDTTFRFCITQGVDIPKTDGEITIYPNPSKGKFKVQMHLKGEKRVVVYNSLGKSVAEYKTQKYILEIDKEQLAAGVYILTIYHETKNEVRKIIIE